MEPATHAPSEVGLESQVRTDSREYNKGTMSKQLIFEIQNSVMNFQTLHTAYMDGRARDISDEPKAPLTDKEKMPAIIVGSGPSLDHSIKFLKNWKGGIFCTTSHALSLIRHGIQPTHLVALDPFCQWSEIAGVDWSKTETKLIAHPGIWPTLMQNWPNEILLYLENIGQPNSFYSTTQKQMYTLREDQGKGMRNPLFRYMIRKDYAMFTCSPPLQLFVADTLGYGTIFLCGCDFAYPGDMDRFADSTVKLDAPNYKIGIDPNGFYTDPNWDSYWEEHPHPLEAIPAERGPMVTNNGIKSERIHIYYKKNFMSAWRLANKTIYTTDHGAVTEVPFADISKVIKKQGYNFPQMKEWAIRKITDKYLASIGCFVIEAGEGKSFVESAAPIEELSAYMINLYQQYVCDSCKNMFQIKDIPPSYEPMKNTLGYMLQASKDDPTKYAEAIVQLSKTIKEIETNTKIVEHEGQECPACKKGKMKHTAKINIEENMERIKKLLDEQNRLVEVKDEKNSQNL